MNRQSEKARAVLPGRRPCVRTSFTHHGIVWHVTFGFADVHNTALKELFLDAGKLGSSAHVIAQDLAIVTSLALRYGVPMVG